MKIDFKSINNDSSGNPRYVCHFLSLITESENIEAEKITQENRQKFPNNFWSSSNIKYNFALTRAKKFFGKKFNNKQYGGGIVFSTYNLQDLENKLLKDMEG